MEPQALIAVSCLSSFGCAFGAARFLQVRMADWNRHRRLSAVQRGNGALPEEVPAWAANVLARARRESQNLARHPPLQRLGAARLEQKLRLAGLERTVTVRGLCCVRADAALAAGAIGAVAGSVLSVELAAIGVIAGLIAGAQLPASALDVAGKERKRSLEAQLSGALEAWCLGLRSGLSLDRSMALYCESFHTPFSIELASARGEWLSGLKTREEALRALAATYDSPLFGRVVEAVVRSARFGSPLAASLDALAMEARQAHRAAVQEQVMKAPVKMMVPVGTLILPSMLLLVLGPVLLELVEGF